MIKTILLPIKGLFRHVSVVRPIVGDIVCLEREPENKVDPNAIRIVVQASNAKIGYLPREFSALSNDKKWWENNLFNRTAKVHFVKNKNNIIIEIKCLSDEIVYENEDEKPNQIHKENTLIKKNKYNKNDGNKDIIKKRKRNHINKEDGYNNEITKNQTNTNDNVIEIYEAFRCHKKINNNSNTNDTCLIALSSLFPIATDRSVKKIIKQIKKDYYNQKKEKKWITMTRNR